jgi:hypothetical protein
MKTLPVTFKPEATVVIRPSRKRFFRIATQIKAIETYQARHGNATFCGITWAALAEMYGEVFHGPGRGRNRNGRGFYRLVKLNKKKG